MTPDKKLHLVKWSYGGWVHTVDGQYVCQNCYLPTDTGAQRCSRCDVWTCSRCYTEDVDDICTTCATCLASGL